MEAGGTKQWRLILELSSEDCGAELSRLGSELSIMMLRTAALTDGG